MEDEANNQEASSPQNSEKAPGKKVLFLDIDGVLNSERTCLAFGGWPHKLNEPGAFDWVSVQLIRNLCRLDGGLRIVLSSTWRETFNYSVVGRFFGLPIIDATPILNVGLYNRGDEIAAWLEANPGVTHYVIVDDNNWMRFDQQEHFVQTSGELGFSHWNFHKCREILDLPKRALGKTNWYFAPGAHENAKFKSEGYTGEPVSAGPYSR